MNKLVLLSIFAISAASFTACKKNADCFDENLYKEYQDKGCTADCPGVIGCDGKTYCNECEANRQGIRIVE